VENISRLEIKNFPDGHGGVFDLIGLQTEESEEQ
jgi:hypothetical protein